MTDQSLSRKLKTLAEAYAKKDFVDDFIRTGSQRFIGRNLYSPSLDYAKVFVGVHSTGRYGLVSVARVYAYQSNPKKVHYMIQSDALIKSNEDIETKIASRTLGLIRSAGFHPDIDFFPYPQEIFLSEENCSLPEEGYFHLPSNLGEVIHQYLIVVNEMNAMHRKIKEISSVADLSWLEELRSKE